MNIGFYGAGKVGTSLARYFKQQGLKVSGFYSLHDAQAIESAHLSGTTAFSSMTQLLEQSDWVFITVSDTYIEHVAAQLMPHLQHHVLFHCSGAAPSYILQIPNAYAFHPLYAFPSKETPLNEQVLFTLEGSPNVEAIKQQLATLGNPIQIIEAHQKAKYHAACVMVSNFVNGLVYAGQQMFESIGFSEEMATQAYKYLFWQNAQNIFERGAVAALTGPIERNDVTTVEKHLQALEASEKEVYATLAKLVIDTAQVKYPEQSYDVVKGKF